jgi:hypothetical protein
MHSGSDHGFPQALLGSGSWEALHNDGGYTPIMKMCKCIQGAITVFPQALLGS